MIHNGVVTVGTTATFVGPLSVMPYRMHLHNNDNTDAVFLGGTAVTTSNGLRLLKEESIDFVLNPKDAIYAIATKEGHTISYFAVTL